jgi:hypothetical protein
MSQDRITLSDLRKSTNQLLEKLQAFQTLQPQGERAEETIGLLLNEPLGLIEYAVALSVVNTFHKDRERKKSLEPFLAKMCELLGTTADQLDIVDMNDFVRQMDEIISERLRQLREKLH